MESFAQIYPENMHLMYDLGASEFKLLFSLVKRMRFGADNFNKVSLNLHVKRDISNETGISVKSIDNCIPKMIKDGVLKREGRGEYWINPMIVFKGSPVARKKMIEKWYDSSMTNSQLM